MSGQGRVSSLTKRQRQIRHKRIKAALDLLDAIWLDSNPSSYEIATGPKGYIGQARAALADLEGAT